MQISERALTGDERAELLRTLAPPRQGCASAVVLAGLLLIFIPFVIAGALRFVLSGLGLPENVAAPVGIALGFVCGAALLLRSRAEDRRQAARWRERRALIESSATARTFRFEVQRAWEVEDFDHGPVYLLKTSSGELVYMHGGFSPKIEAIGEPRSNVEIAVAEPLGIVLSASSSGAELLTAPDSLVDAGLSDPETDEPLEFAVLTAETLPEEWRRVATAAS